MRRRRIADAIMVGTLLLYAVGTLRPTTLPDAPVSPWCVFCGETGAVDLVLNLLVLVPLGLAFALRGVPGSRALALMLALTTCIELAQALVVAGRHPSVRDVVANVAGGSLGLALGIAYPRLLAPSPRIAARLALAATAFWLALQALGILSLRPTFSDEEYFGQPQFTYEHWPPFTGWLLSARVMGEALPHGSFDDWRAFRARLVRGPITMEAVVLPGPSQREYSPFARVVASRREALALAQRGDAVVLSVRTLAADLGFQPTRFLLHGVFPTAEVRGDTIRIGASYDGTTAHLAARRGPVALERQIRASASLAWTLPLPSALPAYIGTTVVRIGTVIYLLAVLTPTMYWARAAGASGPRRSQRIIAALLQVGTPIAGLLVIPMALQMNASPVEEWVTAFVSIGLGIILHSRAEGHRVARMLPAVAP